MNTGLGNTDELNAIDALEAVLPKLSQKDQIFAASLILKGRKYGPSEGQLKWIIILTERVTKPTAPVARETVQVGDLKNIIALFERAKAKFPKIKILVEGKVVVISRAGEKSRVPGSFSIQSEGSYGNNTWFGRILVDGTYQPTAAATPALAEALKAFAAAPAAEAAKFGKKTGRCCFCKIPLGEGKSRLSVEVGYGPDCAKTYDLPWGVKAARAAQEEDVGNREEARLAEIQAA
jgi:hypothetical protein